MPRVRAEFAAATAAARAERAGERPEGTRGRRAPAPRRRRAPPADALPAAGMRFEYMRIRALPSPTGEGRGGVGFARYQHRQPVTLGPVPASELNCFSLGEGGGPYRPLNCPLARHRRRCQGWRCPYGYRHREAAAALISDGGRATLCPPALTRGGRMGGGGEGPPGGRRPG